MTWSKVDWDELLYAAKNDDDTDLVTELIHVGFRTLSAEDASKDVKDDIVQKAVSEVIAKGYQNLWPESVAGLMATVTRRRLIDYLRTAAAKAESAKVEVGDIQDPVDTEAHVIDTIILNDFWGRLHKQLPSDLFVPLYLYHREGWSYEEIAEFQRVPVGTVKSRLARARVQAKRYWA